MIARALMPPKAAVNTVTLVQNELANYRLKKETLEDYLRRKFPVSAYGQIDFRIKVWQSARPKDDEGGQRSLSWKQEVADMFNFWAPRKLTEVGSPVMKLTSRGIYRLTLTQRTRWTTKWRTCGRQRRSWAGIARAVAWMARAWC